METSFLFRIDGAADNSAFFKAVQPTVAHVYAGVDLGLGAVGWAPDFVRVDVSEQNGTVSFTIIELEALRPTALISCRKFLPENSSEIVKTFVDYLDRVIRQCKATADAREMVFFQLRNTIGQSKAVSVATAGALRSATDYVEYRHLMDQPEKFTLIDHKEFSIGRRVLALSGNVSHSAEEVKTVTRCILILDAVVRKLDHSNSTLHGWRASPRTQPLKVFLKKSKDIFPAVQSLILANSVRSGMRINFDVILPELGQIWHDQHGAIMSPEKVRQLIEGFYPTAAEFGSNERMSVIFEKARAFLPKEVT
jgi:hypothetical protein